MKDLYEIGIVFRGFVLIQVKFQELPAQSQTDKDLRGAFISAINTFVENSLNTSLEYLESKQLLFIFKIEEIQSSDGPHKEPVIMYGLVKKKKKPDKQARKFLEEATPLIQMFKAKYNQKDFTESSQFQPFAKDIKNYFD